MNLVARGPSQSGRGSEIDANRSRDAGVGTRQSGASQNTKTGGRPQPDRCLGGHRPHSGEDCKDDESKKSKLEIQLPQCFGFSLQVQLDRALATAVNLAARVAAGTSLASRP